MLISIGARRKEEEGLVTLLLACHARIRTFSRWAATLGPDEAFSEAEIRDTAERCARYFHEALPLHVRDEEESVMPRLAVANAEVTRALETMGAEHAAHVPQVRALVVLLREVANAPSDHQARARLSALATPLMHAFDAHLAMEEALIFPAIAAHFTPEAEAEAVLELRARRQPST